MTYLDSSVVLARVLAEPRSPADAFWRQPFVSSRLLEYEVLNRLTSRVANGQQHAVARLLLGRATMSEMTPQVLARALSPFPVAVRTLDGLHLATMDFLRTQGQSIELATYHQRLAAAAVGLGFALAQV